MMQYESGILGKWLAMIGLAPWSGKGCRIKDAPQLGAEINMTYPSG